MSITERAKDMGVEELVKENKRLKRNWEEEIEACMWWWKKAKDLEEENKKLREELSAYDREYFDEDKKAKNIFKEDDTYIYNAKQVRDIC